MEQYNLEIYPTCKPGILRQNAGGNLVLYSYEEDKYVALDDVGTRVYETCDGIHMASDLINMLCGLYEGPLEVIQQDVFDLLRQFAEAKLIRQNPEDFVKKAAAA